MALKATEAGLLDCVQCCKDWTVTDCDSSLFPEVGVHTILRNSTSCVCPDSREQSLVGLWCYKLLLLLLLWVSLVMFIDCELLAAVCLVWIMSAAVSLLSWVPLDLVLDSVHCFCSEWWFSLLCWVTVSVLLDVYLLNNCCKWVVYELFIVSCCIVDSAVCCLLLLPLLPLLLLSSVTMKSSWLMLSD